MFLAGVLLAIIGSALPVLAIVMQFRKDLFIEVFGWHHLKNKQQITVLLLIVGIALICLGSFFIFK